MKNVKGVGIMLFFVLLIGCKDEKSTPEKVIEKGVFSLTELKGTQISDIEIFSSQYVNLVVVDTFLVVQKNQSPILQVFSTKNYNLLVEAGNMGEGPEELKNPTLLNNTLQSTQNNSPIIQVYDAGSRRIFQYNVLNLIDQNEPFLNTIELPLDETFDVSMVYFNNEDWLILNPSEFNRFLIHSYKDSTQILVPYPDKLDFEVDPYYKLFIYYSSVAMEAKKQQFFSGNLLLGELDLYDIKGNLIKSTKFQENSTLEKDINTLPQNMNSYISDIETDGNYMYALNNNNKLLNADKDEDRNNMQLLVFDMNGTLLKTLPFSDQKFITSIALDRQENKLYAYSLHEEKHNIFVYDLE